MFNELRFGFRVKHGIAPIPGIARTFQDAAVVGICRDAQAISCLLGLRSRYKLGAVVDVRWAHATVTISSVDLHWSDVPQGR